MHKSAPLRILFNDSHVNLPSNTQVPQGGPSRFSQLFSEYFTKHKPKVELISLIFSHNSDTGKIFIRNTNSERSFFEVVCPSGYFDRSYKRSYNKKKYLEFLAPLLQDVSVIFEETKPNIVFLNGFGLTNWIIMEVAHRRKIPVCIQHAGIWKKELQISPRYLSTSMRRILSSLEKETYSKTSHQIFLNEFSRNAFCKIHNLSTKSVFNRSSIIPIPINVDKFKKISIENKNVYKIGMVGRWDKIKNHSAILRLATYADKNDIALKFNIVTKWGDDIVSNFKDKYESLVTILSTMTPEKLSKYYYEQDITIIPSRFDVSPMVLVEAIVCGKATVISKNTGWIDHYKKFGLDKLIISPNASGEKIFNAINDLIVNKDKYIPRFQKLQKKLLADHNPKSVFEKYYQTFNKLKK